MLSDKIKMVALGCAVREILWLEKRCSFVIFAKFFATLADKTNFLEHFCVVFSDILGSDTENVIFKK